MRYFAATLLAASSLLTINAHGQGTWKMSYHDDVMNGKHGVMFEVEATGSTETLNVQCRDGKRVDVVVRTGNVIENLPSSKYSITQQTLSMGANGQRMVPDYQRAVLIKFDTKKPQLEQWDLGPATGEVSATRAKDHLKQILKASVFYVQFKPSAAQEKTLEFPVAGLDRYKAELKENCGVE